MLLWFLGAPVWRRSLGIFSARVPGSDLDVYKMLRLLVFLFFAG